jgi:hypothetical protein
LEEKQEKDDDPSYQRSRVIVDPAVSGFFIDEHGQSLLKEF